MIARRVLVLSLLVAAATIIANDARGDTITLAGSAIPLRDCKVQDFRSGRLYYSDLRGRRQWRELIGVEAVSFDDLPVLDEAERLLAQEDEDAEGAGDAGLAKLLEALLAAKDERHELWTRIRLIRVHELRREYLEAVAHMARVFALRDESYWRIMEPVVNPVPAPYPVALETLEEMRRAKRTVRDYELRAVLRRLQNVVQPLHDAARAAYTGPAIEPGSTRSGYLVEEIRRGALVSPGDAPPSGDDAMLPAEPASPITPSDSRRGDVPSPPGEPVRDREPVAMPRDGGRDGDGRDGRILPLEDSATAIDRLLDDGRAAQAVASCERVAKRPGDRRLDRFLHQYGTALAAAGRREDAAVMFMRCAVLFDSSAFAASSLVETARIYREVYRDERVARRLLQKAIETAERRTPAQRDVVERAQTMLEQKP